jgi:hypothetical protein
MSQSGRGRVVMDSGVVGVVTFNADGTYEVEEILRKASGLGPPSLSDIGKLIADMPGRDEGGGSKNYAKVVLE